MPETTKMMDTERGGETTQYESIKTQTVPTARATGQLGGGSEHSTSKPEGVSKERGDKTAENMRYGQAISEQGVGGKTVGMAGETQQGGAGATSDQREEATDAKSTRRAQGHGPGTGIGG